jgi:Fe-S-cluster containining protein
MCPVDDTPAGTFTATVVLTVLGRSVRLQFNVPAGPTRPVDLMPLFQSLADTFVQIAAEDAEARGTPISCRRSCGACCRQLVPISEFEVESIKQVVRELPEARRNEVLERFAQARKQLGDAGVLVRLRAPESVGREEIRSLADAYFEQGIPCPFLEDESCSIHKDRPLACREYLVTSPAANCAKPTADTIRCVTMPVKVSRAIRHLDTGNGQVRANWIPMILALDWPGREGERSARPSGTAVVAALFRHLTGKDIPEPDP